MAENPGHSISRLFADPYAVKAAYTFFDRDEAIPNACSKGTGNWLMARMKGARSARPAVRYRFVGGLCSSWATLISRPTRYSASSRVAPI